MVLNILFRCFQALLSHFNLVGNIFSFPVLLNFSCLRFVHVRKFYDICRRNKNIQRIKQPNAHHQMKRITLLIAALLFLVTTDIDAQIKLGAKFGWNINKARLDQTLFASTNRQGFLFGPMIDCKIPFLGLGCDAALQYDYRKIQLDAPEESDNKSGVSKLHTIEIPFNVKWTIGNDKFFSVFAATGPQFGWNIGGRSLKRILDRDQYKMKNAIYSWNIGVGCTLLSNVRVGYTYNIGISENAEILYLNDFDNIVHTKLRNNTHQFYLVYFY